MASSSSRRSSPPDLLVPGDLVGPAQLPQPGARLAFVGAQPVHSPADPIRDVVSFMDVPFLPLPAEGPVKAMLAATQIQPRRMWRITCDMLLAFFARHLDQAAGLILEGPSGDYPELTYGAP